MIKSGENAEFITIKAALGGKQIRIILAYGPQEGSSMYDIDDFFTQISMQVNRAILSGNSVMLVGDFNAKLGKGLIQEDVHDISANLLQLRLPLGLSRYVSFWLMDHKREV